MYLILDSQDIFTPCGFMPLLKSTIVKMHGTTLSVHSNSLWNTEVQNLVCQRNIFAPFINTCNFDRRVCTSTQAQFLLPDQGLAARIRVFLKSKS